MPEMASEKEKVKRSFDYSKFNNIDVSDDEESFHPNIEKNFNIKINRHVRDRKIDEQEAEKEVLQDKSDEASKRRLEELERKKIWHVGNMFEVKDERTEIHGYGSSDPKRDLIPGKDEGMANDKDIADFMEFKNKHRALLEDFVLAAGDLSKTRKLMEKEGDLLVTQPHAGTYLLLTCLEYEMEGQSAMMYKCAQQSQILTHIKELARSFNRPARDLVTRWFDKCEDDGPALKIYQTDVDAFAEKVKGRAVEKKAEMAAEEERRKDLEMSYVAKNAGKKPKDAEGDSDDEVRYEVEYKRPDQVGEDEEGELREAVPLVQAMREMSKEQRLQMAPGGIDPLEVFEALPKEMQRCFEEQDIPALVELQKTMDPAIFNPALVQCMKAGLWSQPADDEE